MEERMQRMKETKEHMLEYSRIANEVRVRGGSTSVILH